MNSLERTQFRLNELKKIKENKQFREEWLEQGKKKHEESMQIRRQREESDFAFELTMHKKREKTKEIQKLKSEKLLINEIKDFEATLERMGTSASNQAIDLNDEEQNRKESELYIRKIKMRKLEETAARKDREQRRRKTIVEQQKMFQELEKQRQDEIFVQKLLKQSKAERILAEEVSKTEKWKEVITENRSIRQSVLEERREQDRKIELERIREEAAQRRDEQERKYIIAKAKYEATLREKDRQKKERHYKHCTDVFNSLLDYAFSILDFKEKTDGALPSKEDEKKWKAGFLESTTKQTTANESQPTSDESSQTKFLDELEIEDYTFAKNDWATAERGAYAQNTMLLKAISEIDSVLHPIPKQIEAPKLKSKYEFTILLFGTPYSGKNSIVTKLAAEFSLYLINAADIVAKTIKSLQTVTALPTDVRKGKGSDSVVVAQKSVYDSENEKILSPILDEIKRGGRVSDEILMKIVLNEIQRCENESETYYRGWIIDSFTYNIEILKKLEEEISGFIDYSNVERKEHTIIDISSYFKSVQSNPQLKAFSSILILDVALDEALKRASKQFIDPITHICYTDGLDMPTDEIILKRLAHFDEVKLDKAKLNEDLLKVNKQLLAINQWFSNNFDNVSTLNCSSMSIDRSVESSVNLLQEIKNRTSTPQNYPQHLLSESAAEENTIQEATVQPISEESYKMFELDWDKIENNFVTSLKHVFQNLRGARKDFIQYLENLKKKLLIQLNVEDKKPQLLLNFQLTYNDISLELRSNDEMKFELHKKAEDLQYELWEVCDISREENEKQFVNLKAETWIQDHKRVVLRCFTQLLQLEVNRFVATNKFLKDFYFAKADKKIDTDPASVEELFIDIINDGGKKGAPPKDKKATAVEDAIDPLLERVSKVPDMFKELEETRKKKAAAIKRKPGEPDDSQASVSEYDEGKATEVENFVKKVQIIGTYLKRKMENIDQLLNKTHKVMESWIASKYNYDVNYVSQIILNLQKHIEKELPIGNILDFKTQNIVTLIENKQDINTDAENFVTQFNITQMEGLLKRFQKVSQHQMLCSKIEFVRIFQEIIATSIENSELPSKWYRKSQQEYEQIAEMMDYNSTGFVNFKQFLILSALETAQCSLPVDVKIIKLLRDASTSSSTMTKEQFTQTLLQAISNQPILDFIFTIFATPEATIDVEQVLIYFCLDLQPTGFVQRGFTALSQEEKLNAPKLYKLFHTICINAIDSLDLFSMHQIRAVIADCIKLRRISNNEVLTIRDLEVTNSDTITCKELYQSSLGRLLLSKNSVKLINF